MVRRLGEILVDDFGLARDTIQNALRAQELEAGHAPTASPHSPLPFTGRSKNRFDNAEYLELGRMLRSQNAIISRKIRLYMGVMTGLFLYAAYPLSMLLRDQSPAEASWAGALLVYSTIGLFLTIFVFFQGDDLIKSYGDHLKRRIRISRARSQLRSSCSGVLTVMPRRPARYQRDETHRERPDPEYTGIQRKLPLYYSGWTLIKLGLLVFFVSSIFGRRLAFSLNDLQSGLVTVLLFTPLLFHFLAIMCERYHKYLEEAQSISNENPFPRFSSAHFRRDKKHRVYSRIARTMTVILWVGVAAMAVAHFWPAPEDSSDSHGWIYAGIAIACAALLFLVRLLITRIRLDGFVVNQPPSDLPLN